MAKRIILKETDLSQGGNPPSGYKYLGFDGDDLSERTGATVSAIGGVTSEYTETIVEISTSQMESIGTAPIELLPNSGVNTYYDIDKIIIEYTHGTTTSWGVNNFPYIYFSPNFAKGATMENFWNADQIYFIDFSPLYVKSPSGADIVAASSQYKNESIMFGTWTGANPTISGSPSMRIKIYHKTTTFGT